MFTDFIMSKYDSGLFFWLGFSCCFCWLDHYIRTILLNYDAIREYEKNTSNFFHSHQLSVGVLWLNRPVVLKYLILLSNAHALCRSYHIACFCVYVWTEESDLNTLRVDANFFKNGGKTSVFKNTYPDTCGQGHSVNTAVILLLVLKWIRNEKYSNSVQCHLRQLPE